MKPALYLLPFIAILFGFNGGSWESNNPFDYYLISPQKVHINESKKGLTGVRLWKADIRARASETRNDLPVTEPFNCHNGTSRAYFCDFRQ